MYESQIDVFLSYDQLMGGHLVQFHAIKVYNGGTNRSNLTTREKIHYAIPKIFLGKSKLTHYCITFD